MRFLLIHTSDFMMAALGGNAICNHDNEVLVFICFFGLKEIVSIVSATRDCSIFGEIIAPVEYTIRQPHRPFLCFLIDVTSRACIESGVLRLFVNLRRSTEMLPGDQRTRVGSTTINSSVHFTI